MKRNDAHHASYGQEELNESDNQTRNSSWRVAIPPPPVAHTVAATLSYHRGHQPSFTDRWRVNFPIPYAKVTRGSICISHSPHI